MSNKIFLFNSSSLYAFDYVHPDQAPEVYDKQVDLGLSILESDFDSQCPTEGWSEVGSFSYFSIRSIAETPGRTNSTSMFTSP